MQCSQVTTASPQRNKNKPVDVKSVLQSFTLGIGGGRPVDLTFGKGRVEQVFSFKPPQEESTKCVLMWMNKLQLMPTLVRTT